MEALEMIITLGSSSFNNAACKYNRRYFRIISKLTKFDI